uniref:Uncharacterized protein n=1 Tax=Sander lucioperca TaxID=283035 RepID=A0A8C9WVN9_SANLU
MGSIFQCSNSSLIFLTTFTPRYLKLFWAQVNGEMALSLLETDESNTAGIDRSGLVKYRIISSAYSEILFFVFPILIPAISSLARMASASCSIAKLNKNGDKGHPCRQPLNKSNFSVRVPFIHIWACGLLYIVLTHPIHIIAVFIVSGRMPFSKKSTGCFYLLKLAS